MPSDVLTYSVSGESFTESPRAGSRVSCSPRKTDRTESRQGAPSRRSGMWPRSEVSPKRSTSVPAVHLMTGRDPPGPVGRKPLRQDRASQSQVLFKGVTRRRAPSTTPATQTRSLQDRCSSTSNGVNSVSNSIDPAGSRCREAVSSPRVFGMGAGPCQGTEAREKPH
jgi:hypothetical protein